MKRLLLPPRLFLSLSLLLASAVSTPAAIDRNYKTEPVMSYETSTLMKMLEYIHYNKDAVKESDYPQIITDYMADLDPQRLIFTAQDEAGFKKEYGPRLAADLAYTGSIDPAFAIFRVYEQRVQDRVGWISRELTQNVDFSQNETYAPDRSKNPWPTAGAEADNLWRRRLKYELIQEVLSFKSAEKGKNDASKAAAAPDEKARTETPAKIAASPADAKAQPAATPTDPLENARETVRKRYERMLKTISDYDASELQEAYLSCITHLYDPHSDFMSADTFDEFSIQMKLSLVGIGAVLGLDETGTCVVREVVPGGPADLSGQIKVNDRIIAVAQKEADPVEVIGMKLRRIVQKIRGVKGTKVYLTIIPNDAPDSSLRRQVALVRDVIKLNSARATASLYDVPGADSSPSHVGVITLNSFYDSADESADDATKSSATHDVKELIDKLKKAGAQALVIDLRRNGGGLLSEAISMAGLFIGRQAVVQVRTSTDKSEAFNSEEDTVAWDGPLAVLTSRFSASSSEIFAGALQNYGRAVIIGDSSTHGKGTVQAVLDMKTYMPNRRQDSRTGAAKLTVQKFYLPNGASTQKKGIVPDLTLPSIDDFLPIGESSLPHALMWDEIKPAPNFHGKPLAQSFVSSLRQASQARQDRLEEFAFLRSNIDWYKAKQDLKNISLDLALRRQQKQQDDEFVKRANAERDRLAASNFASRDVKLDAVVKLEAGKKPAVSDATDDGDTDAIQDKEEAKFDIHLRETLRVMTDALSLSKDPKYWADGRPPITYVTSGKG